MMELDFLFLANDDKASVISALCMTVYQALLLTVIFFLCSIHTPVADGKITNVTLFFLSSFCEFPDLFFFFNIWMERKLTVTILNSS